MPNFLRKPNPVRVKNDDDLGGIIDAVRALKSSIAWRRRFSPKGWTKAEINIQYVYTSSAKGRQKVSAFFAVADVKAALKALR